MLLSYAFRVLPRERGLLLAMLLSSACRVLPRACGFLLTIATVRLLSPLAYLNFCQGLFHGNFRLPLTPSYPDLTCNCLPRSASLLLRAITSFCLVYLVFAP